MAIYLHEKYSKEVEQKFTRDSFLSGKASTKYTFEGVKTVNIPTIVSQALNNYTRSGANRYGTPQEVQDTMQSLTMANDKGFSMTVDKGNHTEQQAIKEAGRVLKVEMDEIVIPEVDKNAIKQWTKYAGKVVKEAAALDKTNVLAKLLAARTYLVNNKVKLDNVYVGVSSTVYALLLQTTEFVSADKLNTDVLSNGVVGKVYNMIVVEIPDDYFPSNMNFIVWKKDAVLMPKKIWDTKVHMDPPGLSGHLLEGRFIYDAFVIGEKACGVYVSATNSATKCATPTNNSGTLACSTSGATIMYTLDGTDPRYSTSAKAYTSQLSSTTGLKAVAFKDGAFTSDILAL